MAGRQAKTLTDGQITAALSFLETTRYPLRNRVIFLLSVKAGLRGGEIAGLTWAMITGSDGKVGTTIDLRDAVAKKKSGRTIPLNRDLKAALKALHDDRKPSPRDAVIYSERGTRMSPATVALWFLDLYGRLGFEGCSSHSGRRTFITRAARKVSLAGGSIRDVQQLAGHRSLGTTQGYIEGDTDAKRKLVNLI